MASSSTQNSSLKFNEFCSLCEKISAASRNKRASILQTFISNYQAKYEEGFYRVLRLLLPQLDRERAAYGIKEFTLAKIYIRVLCLHPESTDALKLKNFRAPKNAGDSAGDFAEVAFWVLRSRCAEGNELTLDDVHRHLDTIALRHAEKKPREVDGELEVMLRRMSAQEQKWLIRIVLKDMKLGLGTNRVLLAYHPDARELYDFTNSLQQVCDKLRDPTRRLHEVEVTLFTPCRPMLAERCDVQNVGKHLSRRPGPRYVETKLDGERSQLHYSNGQFKFFSRNAFDFTDSFGNNSLSGSLTPYLAKQLKPSLRNCILDGEMMPWNTKYNCFGTKGMNLDVKSLRVGNVHQPCLCVFDVLYFNDSVMTNRPLSERLATLSDIFTPCEGIMMNATRHIINSEEEVMDALNSAIEKLEEGIVVKEPESVYKPNARREGWIKIKPEYTPGTMVELDLLIIGGYYGEGRRRGLVSHFLLGVAQPPSSPDSDPEVFESMCRVGSGCTMGELAELGQKLEPHWKKVTSPPRCLLYTREKPDLWISPKDSIILQIKASEIVKTDLYQTSFTLRFPRIEKVRYDKPWHGCLTTEEFTKLRQNAYGSLVGSYVTAQSPRTKKRRTARAQPALATQFQASALDRVQTITHIFAGKEICILTGLPEISKQDLECKVAENGGTLVQNPGTSTFCVVAGAEKNARVSNVCKAGLYDVVRAQWLLDCTDAGQLLPWTPREIVSASPTTSHRMKQEFDQYGDSFTLSATMDSLRHSLLSVEKNSISLKKMAKLDMLLFNGCSPFSIFRGCVAYFDLHEQIGEEPLSTNISLRNLSYDFKFQGGKISSTINSETTHVILYSSELDRLEDLIEECGKQGSRAALVQHYWISGSLEAKSCLPTDNYRLHS